jgi:hypothetical protein
MPVLAQDLALASPTMSSLNEGQLRRARGRHGITAIAIAQRHGDRQGAKQVGKIIVQEEREDTTDAT